MAKNRGFPAVRYAHRSAVGASYRGSVRPYLELVHLKAWIHGRFTGAGIFVERRTIEDEGSR